MLTVATVGPDGQPGAQARAALASARQQGFGEPVCLAWDGAAAWLHPALGSDAPPTSWLQLGGRFAAAAGFFQWDGVSGQQALQRLLQHEGPLDRLPWHAMSGAFALLLGREDGVWLLGDALGLMKIHTLGPGQLCSTSLMACCAALPRLEVNRLRAQEYVLLGATHGLDTAVAGVRLLDPTQALDLRSGKHLLVHPPQALLGQVPPASAAQAVASVADALAGEFSQLVQAHGRRIGMALSGGFDSRLILATLTHLGVAPDLFVYGRPADEDVQVARAVAQRLQLPIDAIDKAQRERDLPPVSSTLLAANLRFFDGLPADGVFDRGTDRATRLQQVHAGRLNLNGGGGEILRNFFFLQDRPYTAAQVFWAFYSAWLDDVFLAPDERTAFIQSVQDEILAALGRPHGTADARAQPLSRPEVELVYTLFRLRYWMGRNNSLSARYGAFATPLVTPRLVRLAATLPLAWKNHGRLEAAVIQRLAPAAASGPSAYGFAFDQGPSGLHRFRMGLTLYRPIALRHQSIRVQRALGRIQQPEAPEEWCAALGAAPQADWLNLGALTGLDQVNRLMSLQALLRHRSP